GRCDDPERPVVGEPGDFMKPECQDKPVGDLEYIECLQRVDPIGRHTLYNRQCRKDIQPVPFLKAAVRIIMTEPINLYSCRYQENIFSGRNGHPYLTEWHPAIVQVQSRAEKCGDGKQLDDQV